MERVVEESNKKLISIKKIENLQRHLPSYLSCDLIIHNAKKSKSRAKTLKDFISKKNKIIFQSDFDQKGTKQFLAEKKKAMEKIILIDEITEEKQAKNISISCSKKKTSINKSNKIPKKFSSQNTLSTLNLNFKNAHLKGISKNKINKAHEKNIFEYFLKSDKKIKKRKQNNRKKCSIDSIHTKISNIHANESSHLITGDDSFLYSIIEQMTNFKN